MNGKIVKQGIICFLNMQIRHLKDLREPCLSAPEKKAVWSVISRNGIQSYVYLKILFLIVCYERDRMRETFGMGAALGILTSRLVINGSIHIQINAPMRKLEPQNNYK